jgi:hypothetical protein
MTEFAQGFDFPELNTFIPISILLLHFLYRYDFACLSVGGFVNSAECAVAQCLDYPVLLHPL